jgi:hypothetical protein
MENRVKQTKTISKVLSANDSGETGGHQAGILVPKDPELLAFFPTLDKTVKNPRVALVFREKSGDTWQFWFIYYNNRFFGGTRNEYRLTHMTKFIRINSLKVGDEIVLTNNEDGTRSILFRRANSSITSGKLKLSGQWKIIEI